MKVFKAAFCLMIATIISLPAPTRFARADDGRKYAVAASRYVYLCEEMDESSDRFAIPFSYSVEIKKEYDDWYFVSYAKDEGIYSLVNGYCKKSDLIEVAEPPEKPYLYYPLEVVLHSESHNGSLPDLEIAITVPFYGNYYKGAKAYKCVLYNGEFGYIEGEIDDYQTNVLPSTPTFSEIPSASSDDGNAKLITAVMIIAIALAAIAVLLFTGKHKKIK